MKTLYCMTVSLSVDTRFEHITDFLTPDSIMRKTWGRGWQVMNMLMRGLYLASRRQD